MPTREYLNAGTAYTFQDAGGSVTFTLNSLANGAGRVSNTLDLGAAPRPYLYRFAVSLQFAAALTAGSAVSVYAVTSDGTTPDAASLGTVDAACGTATLMQTNAKLVGAVVMDSTVDNAKQQTHFVAPVWNRYLQVGLWNGGGQALEGTATYQSYVSVTPVWLEGE